MHIIEEVGLRVVTQVHTGRYKYRQYGKAHFSSAGRSLWKKFPINHSLIFITSQPNVIQQIRGVLSSLFLDNCCCMSDFGESWRRRTRGIYCTYYNWTCHQYPYFYSVAPPSGMVKWTLISSFAKRCRTANARSCPVTRFLPHPVLTESANATIKL